MFNKTKKETMYNIIGYYYSWWENGPENDEGEMDPFEEFWHIYLIGVNKNKNIPPIEISLDFDLDKSGGHRTYPSTFDGIEINPLDEPLSEIVKDDDYIGFKKTERFTLDIDGIENHELVINHRRLELSTKENEVSIWVPILLR